MYTGQVNTAFVWAMEMINEEMAREIERFARMEILLCR